MSRKLLSAGTILNRYRIERILGEGGFGVTYLAIEPVQQHYVAIKEYFPKRLANREGGITIVPNRLVEDQRVFKWGLKRFLDEARVLARLDHPSIIKVQKYFELHGTAYLVMDYCHGKPLDKFIAEGKGVSPRRVFQIYTTLLNALEYVHQQGIIHADLKPSNVFVRSDGVPVLLDFGSARQEMLRMAVGQVSDGYSPPEFYETSENIGPWSDIYGLGATFYRLITGSKVPLATDRVKLDTYFPAAKNIIGGYSGKFLELIDSSLKLKIAERPQSIVSIKRLLPDILSFSSRSSSDNDSGSEQYRSEYSNLPLFNWKFVLIGFFVLIAASLIFYEFNYRSVEITVLKSDTKILPIQIEESPALVPESPALISKGTAPLSLENSTFKQELLNLSKVSSSFEISWYSLPKSEQTDRSLRYIFSEIHKQLIAAEEGKDISYNKNSGEWIYKNISLGEIKKLSFSGSDTKCTISTLGPSGGTCSRFNNVFKCQFNDLPERYTYLCLSSVSLK